MILRVFGNASEAPISSSSILKMTFVIDSRLKVFNIKLQVTIPRPDILREERILIPYRNNFKLNIWNYKLTKLIY